MGFSVIYFIVILLSLGDSTGEFDIPSPTSRRLLLLNRVHSSRVDEKKSSPPKYARTGADWNSLPVYIRPQLSHQHTHKSRSYTHLLKSKSKKNDDRSPSNKKKHQHERKKNGTHYDSTLSSSNEPRDLIAVNPVELDRCRTLLQIEHSKKSKSSEQILSSKTKKTTDQTIKLTTPVSIADKHPQKKVKSTGKNTEKLNLDGNKSAKILTNPNEGQPSGSSSPDEQPSAPSKSNPLPIVEQPLGSSNTEPVHKNENSVVDRAFHFVKNMFQLSDDNLDINFTEKVSPIDITQDQRHHSRKLLSLNTNFHQQSSEEPTNDLSFVTASISKRHLLAIKPSASLKTSSNKNKTTKYADANKPKVGWAYRYRISRYLAAQTLPRAGKRKKLPVTGGKPTKLSKSKKSSFSSSAKVAKRKLLEYRNDDSSCNAVKISDQDIVDSVSIIQDFVPKRQLLVSTTNEKHSDDDTEKINERRRLKSLHELTDPIAIVRSYDRGLYKPRVGWQFRYRVSRYIDSLRENIRDDQERLKLGLQAIKRKTPQELSGRRKRVLDKPFPSNRNELKNQPESPSDETKPNVGWRYRYRISRMLAAKQRGEHTDDDKDKRKTRLEGKQKQQDLDPELGQISSEGRRVGWAYRYRIRRKLDQLKQKETETGRPFHLTTLTEQEEKKSTKKQRNEPAEEKSNEKKPSVGWQYRYRVSKMRDAQQREELKSKKPEKTSADEPNLDPVLARLTPEQRLVGWTYRYRIRRKLDSLINPTGQKSANMKRRSKEKLLEESIEKILNIDDIDETPFMEYFRRGSSYVLFGLLPAAKRSLCLLPSPITFSFCKQINAQETSGTGPTTRPIPPRKLRMKKEQRAKQFIRSRVTKLGAADKVTERRVDEAMKDLYKTPSLPPLQTPNLGKSSKKSKKKISRKKTKAQPSPPVPHRTAPRLRTISEVIREEAAALLTSKHTAFRTSEDIHEETNESVHERVKRSTKLPTTRPLIPETDHRVVSTTIIDETGTSSTIDRQSHDTTENMHDVLDFDNNKDSS